MYSNASKQLTDDKLKQILNTLDTILVHLPFLTTLSHEERKTLFRTGPKTADFISEVSVASQLFPQILPPSFNSREFQNGMDLVKKLTALQMKIDLLKEKIDDTLLEAGAESFSSALDIYAHIQANEDKVPGLKPVSHRLKEQFRKFKARNNSSESLELYFD